MEFVRKHRFRIAGSLACFIAAAILVIAVPPSSLLPVAAFVLLTISAAYLSASMVCDMRRSVLFTAFVGVFLVMNLLTGFNVVNTILLASVIIGIDRLLS
jgi:uncharacterized membrane protein